MVLKKKNKIVFFTGSRSDQSTIEPLINSFTNCKFKIIIYFSGSHFSKTLGKTFNFYSKRIKKAEIKKINFFRNVKNFESKKIFQLGFQRILKNLQFDYPEYIYILGDRYEAMIAALAAYKLGIKIIHSGGGEITLGSKDNYYRNIISSKADIHFATTKESFFRLKKKYYKKRIFFTGSPIVQHILKIKKKIKKKNFFLKKKFVLMTFHPATNSKENLPKIIDLIIKELIYNNLKILITFPNQDPGYIDIIKIINKYKNNKNIIIKKNLKEKYFTAIYHSEFLIGNSSSGIIEAPYFYKKVINVGNRQKGRPLDYCVINVPYNLKNLSKNLKIALNKKIKKKSKNFYGKGKTLDNQAKIIKKLMN